MDGSGAGLVAVGGAGGGGGESGTAGSELFGAMEAGRE